MSKRRYKAHFGPARPAVVTRPLPSKTVPRDTAALQKGRQLWSQRRWDDALAAFDQAVMQEPNNARAMVDAAAAFGARYQFERAGALLQRLLNLEERNPAILAQVAESYRLMSRYPEAIKWFERACELAPGDAATPLELPAFANVCTDSTRLTNSSSASSRPVPIGPARS